MVLAKPIAFLGDSLDQLRAFPETARREAGHQLDRVQRGLNPDDWRPMSVIGQGVREVRIRDKAGSFRVFYIAIFAEAIYVLHVLQKKTQRTAKRDLDLAASRFRELRRGKR
jgi:phage-related protein